MHFYALFAYEWHTKQNTNYAPLHINYTCQQLYNIYTQSKKKSKRKYKKIFNFLNLAYGTINTSAKYTMKKYIT